jgi:trans-2,3-dihydro-3-hydroxyanthranilate isomerase
MGHRLAWLDVFTSRPLQGNGLAVVQDADDLDDATMLAFARETRLSETTFVQRAKERGADYRNRIWMTQRELPFAGHPSLGTAVAVAHARDEREARYVQQTIAGLQPVEVERGRGTVARAEMLQEPVAFGEELDPGTVLPALGLQAADAHPELPPQVASTGVPHLMVPIREAAALQRARPEAAPLADLLDRTGAVCAYLA